MITPTLGWIVGGVMLQSISRIHREIGRYEPSNLFYNEVRAKVGRLSALLNELAGFVSAAV